MAKKLISLALLAWLACSCATTNVRATRAYAYEDPDFVVALDRLDDIAEVLQMLDVVLTELPYSPGDDGIDAIALDDERADELQAITRERPATTIRSRPDRWPGLGRPMAQLQPFASPTWCGA